MTNVPKNDYVNVFKPARKPGQQVTPGIHAPEEPYTPSNKLAWGAKGEWGPAKSFEQIGFENQAKQSMSYVGQDGARNSASSPPPCLVTPSALAPTRRRLPQRPVHVGGSR